MAKNSVYQIVTEKIIKELEKGSIPWQKPWIEERPRNINGHYYTGINLLLLSNSSYKCPVWATFNQIKKEGGHVLPGEKSHLVIFYKREKKAVPPKGMSPEEFQEKINLGEIDPKEFEKELWLLRYYRIFNLEQTNLDISQYWEPAQKKKFSLDNAQKIVNNMPQCPPIKHQGNDAFYSISGDYVQLPPVEQFKSKEMYYNTLFHELVHSTGHEKRLNRKSLVAKAAFGSKEYSQEELVAELGSAFLCAELGVQKTIENHAAYVQSWLKALKNDKRMIVIAASQAEKAANYILNK